MLDQSWNGSPREGEGRGLPKRDPVWIAMAFEEMGDSMPDWMFYPDDHGSCGTDVA